MYGNIANDLASAERLLDLFQTKVTVNDPVHGKPLKFSKGEVEFDSVDFHYDPRKSTLRDVSFRVPAGTTVAFVGETGSGKSTILKLINRFYDVTGGSIRIDGQDVRDVTLSRYVILQQDISAPCPPITDVAVF